MRGTKSNLPPVDIGVFSFLTSSLSSIFLLGAGDREVSSLSRWAVSGSFVFVCLNYCLGMVLRLKMKNRVDGAIYCGIFSVVWGVLAYDVSHLLS